MDVNAVNAFKRKRERAVNRHMNVDVVFGTRGRRHGGFYHGDVDVRVIGIDPGLSGALAVVSTAADGTFTVEAVHDLPTYAEKTSTGKNRRFIDPVALAKLIKAIGPVDRVQCERMVAPPGVSGMAAFSMGATMATIAATLRIAAVPYRLVSSGVWKRALDVPADKEAARLYAGRLFQSSEHWQRKKDHNRAEAALIAAHCAIAG
jgi:hypothetical protein